MRLHPTVAQDLHPTPASAQPAPARPRLVALPGGAEVRVPDLRNSPLARTDSGDRGLHRRSAPGSRAGQVGPARPAALPTPDGSRARRPVRDRLVQLLLFLYGPADIGPLGPPIRPRAWEAAAGVLTPQLPRQRILVIPVP